MLDELKYLFILFRDVSNTTFRDEMKINESDNFYSIIYL